jgi:hypothetical protein
MKKIYALILSTLTLTTVQLYSQAPALEWAIRKGGDLTDAAEAISIDAKGYIYITGSYSNAADLSGITISRNASSAFLAKYRSDSTLVWVKSYGVDFHPYSMGIGSDGSIYATGTNTGASRLSIVKYDSLMNIVWSKHSDAGYFGEGIYPSNFGYDIALDNDQNVIVTGQYQESLSFDGTSINATDEFTKRSFVAKLSSNGNVMWLKDGLSDNSIGITVTTDDHSNVYTAGTYFNGSTHAGYIQKYGPNGAIVWTRKADHFEPVSIEAGPNGSVYTAGYVTDGVSTA